METVYLPSTFCPLEQQVQQTSNQFNSRRGMVICFKGATLALLSRTVMWTSRFVSILRYATVPYPRVLASAKWCSWMLIDLSIPVGFRHLSTLKSAILPSSFNHKNIVFGDVRVADHPSHILRELWEWMVPKIPKGHIQSIPSIAILNLKVSDSTHHHKSRALSIGSWSLSRSIILRPWALCSSGTVCSTAWLLLTHFVNWKPPVKQIAMRSFDLVKHCLYISHKCDWLLSKPHKNSQQWTRQIRTL